MISVSNYFLMHLSSMEKIKENFTWLFSFEIEISYNTKSDYLISSIKWVEQPMNYVIKAGMYIK